MPWGWGKFTQHLSHLKKGDNVEGQKEEKKTVLPLTVFHHKDKKMGKLKGCICSVRVGKKKARGHDKKGDQFPPPVGFCGVPS